MLGACLYKNRNIAIIKNVTSIKEIIFESNPLRLQRFEGKEKKRLLAKLNSLQLFQRSIKMWTNFKWKKNLSELIIIHPFIIDKFKKMPSIFRTLARCMVFLWHSIFFMYSKILHRHKKSPTNQCISRNKCYISVFCMVCLLKYFAGW